MHTLPLRSLAFGVAMLSALACGGDTTTPTLSVQAVAVSPSSVTLTGTGEFTALPAQVRLSNGAIDSQTVTWKSSNPSVATVTGGQ